MSLFVDQPALLGSYRRGERAAYEAIYNRYVDEVAILVRRGFFTSRPRIFSVGGISDPVVQDDLIQETFLRAFSATARTGYEAGSPYRPYLLRITKNLLIDRLRRHQRGSDPTTPAATLPDLDDLPNEPASLPEPDPAEQVHRRRQQEATVAFVDQLSDPERTFYLLRYCQGQAQDIVARRMGITRRKVRTMESRLRRGLRRCLIRAKLWP